MADRQAVQQNLNGLLSKLDDPDADLRYMSLNDLLSILNSSSSAYLVHDQYSSSRLADGLLKALDDQHGDVQNQALKCLGPLVNRLPSESLGAILEKLSNLTSSQTIDTSVPNTALRVIVTALPRPQAGQPPSQDASAAYSAVSKVLVPRLTRSTPSQSGRRGSVVKGMLEKDSSKGFSSDAIDVLIQVVVCFGPLLKEAELNALQKSVMSIIDNDTAGTVVTKRALAAISTIVPHFSEAQFSNFVDDLVSRLNSQRTSIVHRRHLIATVGSIARSTPTKFGPHLPTLAPYVFGALGITSFSGICGFSLYFIKYISVIIRTNRHHFKMHLIWFAFAASFVACSTGRNIISLGPGREGSRAILELHGNITSTSLLRRDAQNRCGPTFGKCSGTHCCSTAGYCGVTKSHCQSPDCQIDYGHCDAHTTPGGPPTDQIPRTKVGKVPYGPHAIRSCVAPGKVALTFDDGPNKYTQDLLDLLDKYGAKVTFFITGNNNAKGPIDTPGMPWASLIERMYRSGHQIASHTWSHQDLSKITPRQRRVQMLWNEVALRNILGGFPTYMRPPYSSCTRESGCMDDMGVLGYHVILYDIDTEDYRHDSPNDIQGSKDIFDKNLARAKATEKSWLVIAHDVHEQTVHNLTEHMMKTIASGGFKLVTVGDCLNDPPENWYRIDDSVDKSIIRKTGLTTSNAVSRDGRCGQSITCTGSKFGPCCGKNNRCGNTLKHCGTGCQPNAGVCPRSGGASEKPHDGKLSTISVE
ncbi:glycoside hydrolase/deacetylase [Aspergillus avenaceus]|uniref:Glycoside hydrolase/deacetylase n=1 Tax=Aspergillus avenaceus TaxID=36643 RepID=A0A5N6U2T9_ASPAV|nr:glycoside hydrolase/deacetylase [Aspergillus avenaceus]